jgi:hypothetical protein
MPDRHILMVAMKSRLMVSLSIGPRMMLRKAQ